MDGLERPQKKKIKLTASKTNSALTALATNVSSMGNQFNTAIKQISNTVHHSVDAVKQMNSILESMLEKTIDIRANISRCRNSVGQVDICVRLCNRSPLPLVKGGLLKVELTPVADGTSDEVSCKIAISGNESENTKYGKIEINITKDILPDQKIAYKFVTTICPAGKVRYRGKISFSFKSPGSKSTLSNEANFCINRIQQLHPRLCEEKDQKKYFSYLKQSNIEKQTKILNAKCELETLRGLLGIHATQPVVVDHGLYQLDENMYVLLKTNNTDLKIGDAIEYSCAKDKRSMDMFTENCVYVYFLSDDPNRSKNMQNEFRMP